MGDQALILIEDESEVIREKPYRGLKIVTEDDDFFVLRLNVRTVRTSPGKVVYSVDIEGPDNSIYTLGYSRSQDVAERKMKKSEEQLDAGYGLRIIDSSGKAKLVKVKRRE